MSIIDPVHIEFECEEDIIDYLTRGIVPRRKDAKKLFQAIKNPLDEEEAKLKEGSEVIIRNNTIPVNDVEIFERTMRRVYENRARNRDNILRGTAVVAAGILTRSVLKHNAKIRERKRMEKLEKERYQDDIRFRKR